MLPSSLRRASGFEFGVSSAAGRLRTVMVHRPGLSLRRGPGGRTPGASTRVHAAALRGLGPRRARDEPEDDLE